MTNVTIIALDNVLASSVMGTMDILNQTGSTWNMISGEDPASYFRINLVTKDGNPAYDNYRPVIFPNCSMHDIDSTDLIVISSFSDIATLETSHGVVRWLLKHHEKGTTIASICAGSFILAETGLLNGKTATTHWGLAHQFRERYPDIRLKSDRIITDEGSLICSGGCNSYIDLSIYLVERYCGKQIALESSKALLHDFGRYSQEPYTVCQFRKDHKDLKIIKIQKWVEEHFSERIDIRTLSQSFGFSRRVFERRFKAATGLTPIGYLQQIRVENAKVLLENSDKTFGEISNTVGYEDVGFFRKIFKKNTTLLPKDYRIKFSR